jgi:YgiT-type zinc finger domain-containing protein
MSKVPRCFACGGKAKIVRHDYRFTESGLKNVVLKDLEFTYCPKCREKSPRIPRLSDLMRAVAVGLILKPFELAGEDVRFLRKYLGMSAVEFSRIISVDKSTVSRWENEEQSLGPQSDRLIRVIVLAMGDGLREKLDAAIRQFPDIRKPEGAVRLKLDPRTNKVEYSGVG